MTVHTPGRAHDALPRRAPTPPPQERARRKHQVSSGGGFRLRILLRLLEDLRVELRLGTPETLGFRPIALNLSDGAVAGRTNGPAAWGPPVRRRRRSVRASRRDGAAVDPPVPLFSPLRRLPRLGDGRVSLAFVSLVRKTGYMTTILRLRRPVGDPNGSIQAHRYVRRAPE